MTDLPPPDPRRERSTVLWRYFAVTYAVLLLNQAHFLTMVDTSGLLAWSFAVVVWLTGALVQQLLVFVPVLILNATLRRPNAVVYGTAAVLFSVLQAVTLLDGYVYDLYGFHLNGMVWNLVTTPGGVNSMAAGIWTYVVFFAIILVILGVQLGLLFGVLKWTRLRPGAGTWTWRRTAALAATVVLLVAVEKLTYAVCVFRAYGPVPAASAAFPVYIPITFSTKLRKWGFNDARGETLRGTGAVSHLSYPLKPLEVDPSVKPPNVMWLVSESLRADMLDPEIMPSACKFAAGAMNFRRHYSGGNGTRMGMFSMFYGLTGNYWQPFLAEHRGPVLMDRVIDAGYQLNLYTSAEFAFPEMDKTVFSRVPAKLLHESELPQRWNRDRANIDAILSAIDRRDPSKPFFTFMFFESPHAPYTFPPECAVSKPYVEDLNYLTMDLKKDIGRIKNSYINAVRHLDLPATVLPRLGVKNPPADYSIGVDLVAGPPRDFVMVSGWTEVVYVDNEFKAVFPVKSYNQAKRDVTTRDDAPADKSAFLTSRRDRMEAFLKDIRRFQ